MTSTSALILFAHGAREPRWLGPFQRLQAMTQERLPTVAVELAFLEFMQPALPDLVARLVAAGCQRVTVAPVFLGQGGHVLRDLPVLAEQLRNTHPGIDLQVATAVGEDVSVLAAIRDYCISQV